MNERSLRSQLSLRYRFMLVFFVLIIVPFLLVGYIALSKSETTLRNTNLDSVKQMRNNLDYFLQYVAIEQDKLMASADMQELFDRTAAGAAGESESDIAYADRLLSYADGVNYSNKLFKIRLYPLVPAEHPTYMQSVYGGADIGREAWFADIAERGRSFWTVFGPADHPGLFMQPVLSSVKRLHSLKSFGPMAIVVMDIRPAILADFIYPVKQFPHQQILLINRDNRIVYSTKMAYDSPVIDAGLRKALDASPDSGTFDYRDKDAILSIAPLLDNELRIVSITPLKDLDNPVAVLSTLTLSFLVFYFLLSLVLAGYLTVTYTTPISSLVRHMKRSARSSFSEFAASDSRLAERRDEIGLLYRGMGGMIREIQRLLQETKESERKKKQLEYQVLAYQINPHFLYNTLDTIRWKAEAHGVEEISGIVRSLSSLFRLSLNRGKELTTVGRELELLRSYIAIESVRQADTARVTFLIEDELLALPLMRLILQPLVENAIRHGAAGREGAGMIIVQGAIEEEAIRFRIADNGPGIPEDIRKTLLDPEQAGRREREGGLGLLNVHERLRHYFGEPYGLDILSEPERGTTVVLTHPLLPADTTEIDEWQGAAR